jgi:hypothetical protein
MSKVAIVCAALLCAGSAFGQRWEFGGVGGASIYRPAEAKAGAASADAGFANGYAFGVVLGNTVTNYIGGEVRYLYSQNDLELKSGTAKATLAGRSHLAHYDVLVHFAKLDAKVRPFAAVGAGMRLYQGTGIESAAQPLANLGLLTHASQWKPVVTFGAGVKLRAGKKAVFRAEFRDCLSPFPEKVIAPARGADIKGWLHGFVALFGVGYLF